MSWMTLTYLPTAQSWRQHLPFPFSIFPVAIALVHVSIFFSLDCHITFLIGFSTPSYQVS